MQHLDFNFDPTSSVLQLRPTSALSADDFAKIVEVVDPHIEATGSLRGIIIETPSFPGWESLGAMMAHFRFVRDHHRKVKKIAVVTDSTFGEIAEKLASHFVAAEIRHFPSGELSQAKEWILAPS
ncbi:hypothetical protein Pan44_39720 [Caulifigura coniformis]|uniref:STAS/SEC14 domain-containing protein n=1 Tax=Caulifigura coniformis TaxID=2527983 RepID=A0A517SIH1_9PLAN|nr:STAS/SEC14 domain-containing protein [Caulifigura coniformis]QDT55924.1 hypothetical protein Pan44_39720 [Caulifigura coniformis]